MTDGQPLNQFKEKLVDFATEARRAIRNPFVILPVDPSIEYQTFEVMKQWEHPTGTKYQSFDLQKLMTQTRVFDLITAYSKDGQKGSISSDEIEDTLSWNLSREIAEQINETIKGDNNRNHILLLGNLGALFPFASASEILDQLEKLHVKATIGIIFPGPTTASGVSFFGKKQNHYYPAHIIDNQLEQLTGVTV